MKIFTITSSMLLALFAFMSCTSEDNSKFTSTPYNSKGVFTLNDFCSSEFEKDLDNDNLFVNTGVQGVWWLNPENVEVVDGILNLTAKYDPKNVNNRDLYFSSGMVRTKGEATYGYFEARIKGADVWPGVCPAFWLTTESNFSTPQAIEGKPENTITYNEIDIIEIQQVAKNKRIMACNTHLAAIMTREDGTMYSQRLSAGGIPVIGKNEFLVDWDAEKDYHIYACENRPDSTIFYIDNKRVAARPNYYLHLPMCMKVSMGIRTPFESYKTGKRLPVETTPEKAEKAGFPTIMYVDYIRSYTRDYSDFKSNKKLFDAEEAGFVKPSKK